jgi:hypothetical protein
VTGATIGWAATNGVQLSACNGASACTVISDQDGNAATWLTPATAGVSTITATLAPGVYNPSASVSATLNATESASDLGVLTPYLWIAQGATVNVPLTARVLSNGNPQNNVAVNFSVASGSGSLSSSSIASNSGGYASDTLTLANFGGTVQVNVCATLANLVCKQIYANPVPLSQLNLEPVAGAGQETAAGTLQPVIVRVVDAASPPHSVTGAAVAFQTTVLRPQGTTTTNGGGETNPTNSGMPVILSVSASTVASDVNGLATITPSSAGFSPPLDVDVAISAGANAALNDALQLFPSTTSDEQQGTTVDPRPPVRLLPLNGTPPWRDSEVAERCR